MTVKAVTPSISILVLVTVVSALGLRRPEASSSPERRNGEGKAHRSLQIEETGANG
jgi:hypothetical protein